MRLAKLIAGDLVRAVRSHAREAGRLALVTAFALFMVTTVMEMGRHLEQATVDYLWTKSALLWNVCLGIACACWAVSALRRRYAKPALKSDVDLDQVVELVRNGARLFDAIGQVQDDKAAVSNGAIEAPTPGR